MCSPHKGSAPTKSTTRPPPPDPATCSSTPVSCPMPFPSLQTHLTIQDRSTSYLSLPNSLLSQLSKQASAARMHLYYLQFTIFSHVPPSDYNDVFKYPSVIIYELIYQLKCEFHGGTDCALSVFVYLIRLRFKFQLFYIVTV